MSSTEGKMPDRIGELKSNKMVFCRSVKALRKRDTTYQTAHGAHGDDRGRKEREIG
jgi:hypothetical protein